MRVGALRVGDERRSGARVSGISPAHGVAGGGTAVTISGRGFTGETSASVGGANIGAFAVVNDSTITGTTAAGPHGYADVAVAGGPSGTLTLPNGFHYDQNPIIAAVVPGHGPIGGQAIEIHGSGFTGMTGAVIGGLACGPDFNVISDVRIDTETKPHAYGDVDVTVNGVFGETSTLVNGYHYDQPLATFTSVTPDHGPPSGGTTLTIMGHNLLTATGAKAGGVALTGFQVFTDFDCVGNTGAHAIGVVDVTVDNDSGTATDPGAYEYRFNPADLNLSVWERASYGGPPWNGVASAGSSGAKALVSVSGPTDPSQGAAVNGKIPALFDGTDLLSLKTSGVQNTVLDVIGAGDWSYAFLVYVHAIVGASAPGLFYNNDGVFADSGGYFGLYLSTSGGNNAQIGVYNFGALPLALPGLDRYMLIQAKYDSGAGRLHGRIDSALWTDMACGSPASTGGSMRAGKGFLGFFNGRMLEGLVSPTLFSDADFDNIKAYTNARYGFSL